MDMTRRWATLALALVTSFAGLTACSDADTRAQIDLQDFVKGADTEWEYLAAKDITDKECPDTGCDQAVQSPYVSILKFPSVDKAETFAKGCDCHQIDPLVIRFDGKPVSEKDRRAIIDTLSNINAGSAD